MMTADIPFETRVEAMGARDGVGTTSPATSAPASFIAIAIPPPGATPTSSTARFPPHAVSATQAITVTPALGPTPMAER